MSSPDPIMCNLSRERLLRWLEANAPGYWLKPDGSQSWTLYRPYLVERIAARLRFGDRWVKLR